MWLSKSGVHRASSSILRSVPDTSSGLAPRLVPGPRHCSVTGASQARGPASGRWWP